MCAHAARRTPPPDPMLDAIRKRLQLQYALRQRGARFWTACQGLQRNGCVAIRSIMSACAMRWPPWPKTSARSSMRN